MTDPEDNTSRPGSGADLSRRMDRMERRQDTFDGKLTELGAVVGRVELNQKHAEELAILRFNAVDNAVKSIDGTLERFMGRINAIVSGEVKLPQAAAGEKLVADYLEWRKDVERRLGEGEDSRERKDARDVGVLSVFGGAKQVILIGAAVASPIVTVLVVLLK